MNHCEEGANHCSGPTSGARTALSTRIRLHAPTKARAASAAASSSACFFCSPTLARFISLICPCSPAISRHRSRFSRSRPATSLCFRLSPLISSCRLRSRSVYLEGEEGVNHCEEGANHCEEVAQPLRVPEGGGGGEPL